MADRLSKTHAPEGKTAVAYTREDKGRFGKGNPGRPKGSLNWEKRKLADAARELFEKHCPDEILSILHGDNDVVKMRCIEWLADRAYGKAPVVVRAGIDPDSPEGILLMLANQTLPGSSEEQTS